MSNDRTTSVGLFHFAHSYASCAQELTKSSLNVTHQDAPIRFLFSHAIELYLKSYLVANGISTQELRSRNFGHNMNNLRSSAQKFGLSLSVEQENQIDHLNNAILDRYIQTGAVTILLPETLFNLCKHLNNTIGQTAYDTQNISRVPIGLE